MNVEGKRIIVTGGGMGMGGAVVVALARAGAKVASLDISAEAGEARAATANEGNPGAVSFHPCDVSQRSEVESAFADAVAALGGLDGVVHAAGIETLSPPEDLTDEMWSRMIAVNVTGTFLVNQAAFPHLKDNGGVILNFGSDAGLIGYAYSPHYSASKGAVMAWTRSVAAAWGKYNIRVNSMVPAIKTEMYEKHCKSMPPEELAWHQEDIRTHIMLRGEMGDPMEDFAPVVLFMLSEGAQFITGQLISVNGGLGITR
jgi:NAD(P)-dependent dehydrogenase (short-subunit alcohol dehydrogenase family)